MDNSIFEKVEQIEKKYQELGVTLSDPAVIQDYEKFQKHMMQTAELYQEMIQNGIKGEDARSILPNATTSSLVCSLNLRELIHLANLRLCTRAQLEIRLAVKKMCMLVEEREPWLKTHLVPKCERLGYCDEDNSCGRMKTKNG